MVCLRRHPPRLCHDTAATSELASQGAKRMRNRLMVRQKSKVAAVNPMTKMCDVILRK